jgi:hypothetical protein
MARVPPVLCMEMLWALLALVGTAWFPLGAAVVRVENSSFESPETKSMDTRINGWDKSEKPSWYPATAEIEWDALTGLFRNADFGSSEYIENCDGNQAMWLYAVPEVALFQDLDKQTARFQAGHGYELSIGLIGLGGGMLEGVPLELSLYYRDFEQSRVTVLQTTVTNSKSLFEDRNHLVEFKLSLPSIESGAACANRPIGIGLRSTVTADLQGGFWVVDRVRLTDTTTTISGAFNADRHFELTIESAPGLEFEVSSTPDPVGKSAVWTSLGTFKNPTGRVQVVDPDPMSKRRFYRLDSVPANL